MCVNAENKEQMLNDVFAKVGEEYGYTATAEFSSFRDLKMKWVRTSTWSDFQVSDYLQDAPENVLEALARTVFSKLQGDDGGYSKETVAWLTAPEFSEKHRPIYLERDQRIGSEEGECKSLQEAVDRLVEKGLIERDPSIEILWSKEPETGESGRSSVLMRVVTVNKALDSDDVPDEIVDLVLLKHLAMVGEGFTGDRMKAEANVDATLRKYPGFDGIIEWLEGHCLSI